jgi:hypothetical protein
LQALTILIKIALYIFDNVYERDKLGTCKPPRNKAKAANRRVSGLSLLDVLMLIENFDVRIIRELVESSTKNRIAAEFIYTQKSMLTNSCAPILNKSLRFTLNLPSGRQGRGPKLTVNRDQCGGDERANQRRLDSTRKRAGHFTQSIIFLPVVLCVYAIPWNIKSHFYFCVICILA